MFVMKSSRFLMDASTGIPELGGCCLCWSMVDPKFPILDGSMNIVWMQPAPGMEGDHHERVQPVFANARPRVPRARLVVSDRRRFC
jgi:hypothetical protein